MFNLSRLWAIAPLGLLLCVATAYINVGIIAIDDYAGSIALIIPAQSQKPLLEIANANFHPPIPKLAMALVSRGAYLLGVETPVNQLRFVLVVLGLFSFLVHFICIPRFFHNFKEPLLPLVCALLICFYFLCPLFMTRPMIESLSMPFLSLSCFFACSYWRNANTRALLYALGLMVLASMMRFQSGICILGLLGILVVLRRYRDLILFFVVCGVAFVITGWLDQILRGSFHFTLVNYINYNFRFASEHYGKMPVYTFGALFAALTIPPTFFMRYNGLKWRELYSPLFPVIVYFTVFLIAHTLVPHKEERFMVPVLPLFLVLLTPLIVYLIQNRHPWRLVYFSLVNGVVLYFASFSVAQNNIVGLALFLDRHTEFKAVRSLQDTLVIFPQALVLRAIHVERVSEEQLNTPIPCDTALAVRESLVRNLALMNVERLATFHPGLLEDLIIKANPKKNKRREAISVFIQAGCGNQSRSVSKFYRGMTLTLARLQIIKSVLKRSRISDPS